MNSCRLFCKLRFQNVYNIHLVQIKLFTMRGRYQAINDTALYYAGSNPQWSAQTSFPIWHILPLFPDYRCKDSIPAYPLQNDSY
jgi:hypothetical protein